MILLRLAASTLKVFGHNKLRTFLSALGITIGIGAVAAVISVGKSSQSVITSQIQGLGSNIVYVTPGLIDFKSGRGRQPGASATTLSLKDATDIKHLGEQLITAVSPEVSQTAVVENKTATNIVNVVGADTEYQAVHSVELSSGTFLSADAILHKKHDIVLGATVVDKLFGQNATGVVGKKVTIRGDDFTIVGVTKKSGGFGPIDVDNAVAIPRPVAESVFSQSFLSTIYAKAADNTDVAKTADQIRTILLKNHKITTKQDADFTVLTQDDILSVVGSVTTILTTAISAIAGISLLVGGVGILNTMLFTVVQRTREIGLRKALGATRFHILWQFLVEAILLSLIGATLGVLLSLGIITIAEHFLDFGVSLSWSAVGLSAAVSIAIGLIFGIAPARRAARLNPIESLRHE